MHECAGAVKEALELAVTPLRQWLWLLYTLLQTESRGITE